MATKKKPSGKQEKKKSATAASRRLLAVKVQVQQEAILLSLEAGSSRASACGAAGVGRSTFYEWMEKDEGFREAVEAVEQALIDTVESVALSCAMKAEDDPRYQRTMLAWLEAKGGWNRSGLFKFIDLDHLSDEELGAVANGESIEAVLARTRTGRAEAAGS